MSIPKQTENPNGLHRKYQIRNHDGSAVDPDAEFFVLRLDGGCKDRVHLDACRRAAWEYGKAVMGTHLELVGTDLAVLLSRHHSEEHSA